MSELNSPYQETVRGARYKEARVFYQKTGRAKYISHLDVTRCMQRAIQRAGLSVWYTEGFNPHIYITFALPLSLGYESECEAMDVRLQSPSSEESCEQIQDRLNAVLPPDIRVTKVAAPVRKPDEIVAACYDVCLLADDVDANVWVEKFRTMLEHPIEVEKHTKKGNKRIDIRPDVELLQLNAIPGGIALSLKTAAGTTKNINPTLLTDEFLRRMEAKRPITRVVRKQLLCTDETEFA